MTTLNFGVYTTSIKPPVVVVNNTKLLLHFDGADGSTSIIDSSPYANALSIVGGDTISTAQSKFGEASLLCNSPSYVAAPDVAIGTSPFTFEGWFYLGSISNSFVIWENSLMQLRVNNGGIIVFSSNFAGGQTGNTNFSTGVWHYFNLSRASVGANIVLTVDGTVEVSMYGNNDYGTVTSHAIGGSTNSAYSFSNCRLDEVRLTVGASQSASVPTGPFT